MRNMDLKNIFLPFLVFISVAAFGQKEKGKVISAPKIPQNTPKTPPKDVKNSEFDFIFEDEPKLRFQNDYETQNVKPGNTTSPSAVGSGIRIEPLRELNEIIHEDTSSIDESELMIVEIEEEAQFAGNENMVKVASYYAIWDTKSLDPYGKRPQDFKENIHLTLYNENEGRNWAPMLEDFKRLSSHFGWRWKRWHKGTDLALDTGDKVRVAFDGVVRISGTYSGYGRTVLVRHYNGLETLYGHLSKLAFEPNTLVKAGDVIGLGGSTGRSSGPHLHFETRYEGNQFDAENIYDFSNGKVDIKTKDFTLSSKLYDYLRGGRSVVSGDQAVSDAVEEDTDDIDDDEFEEEVPVQTQQKVWYTVKKGDTLSSIARKSNMQLNEMLKLNRIAANKKLYPGLKLRIR